MDSRAGTFSGNFSSGNTPALIRRLPIGAERQPSGGVHFRVWAPRRRKVEVMLGEGDGVPYKLDREGNGYFSAVILNAAPDMLYRYRLDGKNSYPDPVSRFQPDGPHGPSQIVDSDEFGWTDEIGAALGSQVRLFMKCISGLLPAKEPGTRPL